MKRIFFSILLCLISAPAFATIAIVQQGGANGKCGDTTVNISMTGVDSAVAYVSYFFSSGRPDALSDGTNTYTALTQQETSGGLGGRSFYLKNSSISGTVTLSVSSGSGYSAPVICVITFSGGHTSSPFDQENGDVAHSAATTIQTGNVTPSQDNEIIITGVSDTGASTETINSSFTVAVTSAISMRFPTAMAYQIQTTATARNPTWTVGAGSDIATTIATFKSAPAAGGTAKRILTLGVGD